MREVIQTASGAIAIERSSDPARPVLVVLGQGLLSVRVKLTAEQAAQIVAAALCAAPEALPMKAAYLRKYLAKWGEA